jgi:molybdopterin molybdotransferase
MTGVEGFSKTSQTSNSFGKRLPRQTNSQPLAESSSKALLAEGFAASAYNRSMAVSPHTVNFAHASTIVRASLEELAARAIPHDEVELLDAVERVLAEPLIADRDQPPFSRATRDGFAARADDWMQGNLRIQGTLAAGGMWSGGPIGRGACVEIMTGAPVPQETDCVVMVEHVMRSGDVVSLQPGRAIEAGENVVPRGAEAAAGSVLVPAGARVTPSIVAAAAANGAARLKVYRRPRVAIVSTGDELVAVDAQPLQWQIRNSNSYSLSAQVKALGGEPRLYAPVPDKAEALHDAIATASADCDLLLLSGGVSMGRFDLVEPALEAHAGAFRFTGVRMQPGKPLVFGTLREGALPFFGLPGNPVSTMVCFAAFVAPVLAALGGEADYTLPLAMARSLSAVGAKAELRRFLPARALRSFEGTTVATIAWHGSGDTASAARANCFLIVPEGTAVAPGDSVTILLA